MDDVDHAIRELELDSELRVALDEAVQARRDLEVAEGHRCSHPDHTVGLRSQLAQRQLGRLYFLGDPLAAAVEDISDFREAHAARRAAKQLSAESILQGRDFATDRGLRDPELARGGGKAASFDDTTKDEHAREVSDSKIVTHMKQYYPKYSIVE